jgi:tRNA (cytidine/uridine-2'-O-)-methyltransferase
VGPRLWYITNVLNIILYQPEIPPNTGNIMRLCANAGAHLHLIGPLGFVLDNTRLKRAGLDYRELACVTTHDSWQAFHESHTEMPIWSLTTGGSLRYDQACFQQGDGLIFGPETRGLPENVLDAIGRERSLRIPMVGDSRSLNLSNSVALVLYEAWRQMSFSGSVDT